MTCRPRAAASLVVVGVLLGAPIMTAACALWCPPGASAAGRTGLGVVPAEASACDTPHHDVADRDPNPAAPLPSAGEAAVGRGGASCCAATGLAAVDVAAADGIRGDRAGVAPVPVVWRAARLSRPARGPSVVGVRHPAGHSSPPTVLRI